MTRRKLLAMLGALPLVRLRQIPTPARPQGVYFSREPGLYFSREHAEQDAHGREIIEVDVLRRHPRTRALLSSDEQYVMLGYQNQVGYTFEERGEYLVPVRDPTPWNVVESAKVVLPNPRLRHDTPDRQARFVRHAPYSHEALTRGWPRWFGDPRPPVYVEDA